VQRVAVIGPSGSGKTTLGRWIESNFALPFTDLDDAHWRPGWIEAPLDEFRGEVDRLTVASRWVLAGNYTEVRDLVWARADTLVWLDLPLAQVLWRSSLRGLQHWWTRAPICNGNRQTLSKIVNGRDSLIGYTLLTFNARRREWPALLADFANGHLERSRLRSQAEIEEWKRGVETPRNRNAQTGNTPVER